MNQTIAAIASGGGKAAIAVIRVSGPKSLSLFKKLTRSKIKPKPNYIKPYWLYDSKGIIDQSMVVYFQSPKSFSGEDMLEIHCHGSEVVQKQLLKEIYKFGVNPAKPGEFSERAYRNGKIDITQAEAIMDLVAAENTQIAKLAVRQLAGEFSEKIHYIRDSLTTLSAGLSADMDFSEEDLPSTSQAEIVKILNNSIFELQKIKANSELLPKLTNGITIALVGLPNAGKSTLLNTLLGYERSIVTKVAGTTRDTISETVEINGVNYHFIDTAGLNSDPDEVEKIGIERTLKALKGADLTLLLVEPNMLAKTQQYLKANGLQEILKNTDIKTVYTKSDLLKNPQGRLSISAKNKTGISKLIDVIETTTKGKYVGDINILTVRQLDIVNQTESLLINLLDNTNNLTYDLICAELESIINLLNSITGEQANKQIIDSIFRNFCIGK